jgi:hypothetical protein
MFKRSILGMVMVLLGVLAVSAPAKVISVNIDTCAENQLDPALIGSNPTAGVVPASNWNDLRVGSGTWQSMHDDSGAGNVGEFTAFYESPGSSYVPISPWPGYSTALRNEADNKLLSGHIYHAAGADTVAQFSNIPYAAYDVYVYYNSGAITNNYQTFTIDGTSFAAVGSELSTTPDTAFVLSNGNNDANYVKFSNVNLSNFTLRASATSGYSYFNGFQIVQAPEPMTVGLLTLGGLLLRRRN